MLSRSDLVGAATSVAERVGGADRVAVLATPSASTVLAITGCLIAGVPFVPVPSDVGAAERRHMLTDSGAQAWLGPEPDEPEGLPHIPVRLHARSWHRYPEPAPEATAMVIYTSGTTGAPKGVVVSRRAIAADLDALAQAWQWTARRRPGARVAAVSHPRAGAGLARARCGSEIASCTPENRHRPATPRPARKPAARCFSRSRRCGRGWWPTRPPPRRCGRRGCLVSGSAALPVPVFDRLAELTGHRPIERYGASESLITISTRADGERRPGWVGLPVAGVQTRLLDDNGDPVPQDGETVGKLQVRGPTLFDGYLNRPEATAEAFDADGWYRTGDVAVVDGEGMYRIVGRESVDLIKSGGYRVGAGEIETSLLGHPGVQEAAVVGMPDEDLGQRIVAFVVGSADLNTDELINYVAQELSVHKRPREVRIVDALPRNAMGKVLKKQLLSEG